MDCGLASESLKKILRSFDSATAIPMPIATPWPSGPVVASTPLIPTSG